jgi:2,4-dienoyl-CoA reductase-like NADH-dependent reductase (Old Yellow Enzyme family)
MSLFNPLTLRGVTLPNRIAVSPMCQYSCDNGFANDWHLVHLGSRAVGGAGLVFTEAAAVAPEGRISPQDLGIWDDKHAEALAPIVRFLKTQGSIPGIQLAHAGRKASTHRPWEGNDAVLPEQGGWTDVWAPSPIPFSADYVSPKELDRAGIDRIVKAFTDSAARSAGAGFEVVEIHAAHGYLLHEFLSPLSNKRADEYGGNIENRARMLKRVVSAVRERIPDLALFVRLSVTDWVEGGLTVEESVEVARIAKQAGADLIDCSSGGSVPITSIPVGPGYQTPFAERIRREASVPTGAVGLITGPEQADHIIRTGQADIVLLAREMLRDPYWPLHAAEELNVKMSWPVQYLRAASKGSTARHGLIELED